MRLLFGSRDKRDRDEGIQTPKLPIFCKEHGCKLITKESKGGTEFDTQTGLGYTTYVEYLVCPVFPDEMIKYTGNVYKRVAEPVCDSQSGPPIPVSERLLKDMIRKLDRQHSWSEFAAGEPEYRHLRERVRYIDEIHQIL